MDLSVKDFWRLAIQSTLFTPEQGKELSARFSSMRGGDDKSNGRALSEWLIAENCLSRYQAKILLAGRAGPFRYGDYQVYDRIGQGRFKGLFRAVHLPTRHTVMLDFVAGHVEARQWAAIAAHALSASGVTHPHLMRCYEPVDVRSHKFVALEDLRGRTLAETLSSGPLAPSDAARFARQIAQALAAVHKSSGAHGDVRPDNIWVSADGHSRLLFDPQASPPPLDFQSPDPSGQTLLRADYAAPELARGDKPDALSDIYALGCATYEMLSGRPPFAGGDVAQKTQRHATEATQPLDPQHVPTALSQITAYMMAKNREVRYQNASDIAAQLAPLVDPAWSSAAPAIPETLAPYRNAIRTRQAELAGARKATVPTQPARPAPQIQVAKLNANDSPAAGGEAPSSVRRGKKKDPLPWILGGVGAAGVAVIALVIALNGGDTPTEVAHDDTGDTPAVRSVSGVGGATGQAGVNPGGSPTTASTGASTTGASTGTAAPPSAPPPDDGVSLFVSPTAGSPIAFDFVPPGGLAYLHLRPAQLLSHQPGQLALKALGQQFETHRQNWESRAGVPLEQAESVLLAFLERKDIFPPTASVVRLSQPIALSELLQRWQSPEAKQTADGKTYYIRGDTAYLVGPSASAAPAGASAAEGEPDGGNSGGNSGEASGVTLFVFGPVDDIVAVAERNGAAPTLRRQYSELLTSSDSERTLTAVFSPFDLQNRFFHDGLSFYFGAPAKIREPLQWLFGDDLQAVAASLHLDSEQLFLEMQFATRDANVQYDLAEALRSRIDQAQSSMELYIDRLNPGKYWSRFSRRFPNMFVMLHDNTRIQVEDRHAVMNAVLPAVAAHNFAFGLEIVLASTPGANPAAVAAAPPPRDPQDIDELLEQKIDVAFDQLSLEFSMAQVAEATKEKYTLDFPFQIKIIGADLQDDGITRNQQVRDVNERGAVLADVLTRMVMKANPITTVKAPSEDDQKLIWVVGPNPDDTEQRILLITTRKAAAKKNYTLPAPFVKK